APAGLAGLGGSRGALAPGRDADFVVWDPEEIRAVDPALLQQRHKVTPYAGRRLQGVVRTTWLRGEKIYERGRLLSRSSGEMLLSG
ncbi:MAG: amidohydrolase family protein, partial [Acidobacteriota bacterium]|nr:amidohydrolase family protein [Acidobacteriota bacterium]